MKLAFNCLDSGLGNGGGSNTTVMCAKTLEELGHRCDILATVDNFTWFDHKPVISYVPNDLDVIIATACTTVFSTLRSNVSKKAYYIRGHETWMYNEEQLSYCYNSGLFNITNSCGLRNKLKDGFGAKSVVVRQGISLDAWEDRKLRPTNKMRIGCLYQKKSTKRWKDFAKLASILGSDDHEYVAFGTELRKEEFLDDFICSPTHEQLVDLYSSCHIWFAPTELEGLHNVPMEAALCGCLIVCSDAKMNGMVCDYAFDTGSLPTAMIYKARDVEDAVALIEDPDYTLVQNMQFFVTEFISSREVNMTKLVKILENI